MELRRAAAFALLLLVPGGCKKARSSPLLAAIEVPVASSADRQRLIAVLRQAARVDPTLHADDATTAWMAMQARDTRTPPNKRATFYAGVWRGAKDEEPIARAMDYLHPGRVWVMFENGSRPAADRAFREAALRALAQQFPQARSLPVVTGGTLPLEADMRLTPAGYRILPQRAATYGLPANSPLLAH